MRILSLQLVDFRNYENQSVHFDKQKNFFIGKNAQGKTNLLEAIYLICLTKSFRTRHEKEAINFDKNQFILKASLEFEKSIKKNVTLSCSRNGSKKLVVNRKQINKISSFIGELPVVVSSPDEYEITTGPPPERRKFFDILISQIDKKYLHDLVEYYQVLKQKNAILQSWKHGTKIFKEAIEPWNQQLAAIGTRIVIRRQHFCNELSRLLKQIYASFTQSQEILELFYQPNLAFQELDSIQDHFRNHLTKILDREIQRGMSLSGPHRDEFIFKINGRELKKFGSRGQHKTVLISLALAVYELIYLLKKEKPVILIDDFFSELDEDREALILKQLEKAGQIFISGTEITENLIDENSQVFYIENGKIIKKEM